MSSESSLNEALTPVRQQYLDIKRQHPGAILFFRLGDFYETFDEDAELVAKELDIVLTSRNVAKGARVPMAGVPHHAAESYLARLIERGHHVAICEQVGSEPIKGLMPRQVVRIVTPGTVVEPGLLPGDANNYLAAALVHEGRAGLAYADLTTGEFAATELDAAALRAELGRLAPAETIYIDKELDLAGLPGHGSAWPAYRFEPARAKDALLSHFKASTLQSYGLDSRPLAARAAGALLQYVQETQPASLALLTSLRAYTLDEFMNLDASARRNLELTETLRGEQAGSLLGTLDRAVTPMGRRLLRQWVGKPLLELGAIHARQEGVAWLHADGMRRAELRSALKPLGDLERMVNRVLGGTAQPRDLAAMRSTLEALPAVLKLAVNLKSPVSALLIGLSDCAAELKLLQSAIADEPPAVLGHIGVMRAGYSSELDELMAATSHAREWIANLESAERERTGIKSLKVGYNRVHGYYIEVTKAKDDGNLPAEYIRKQTLVNAERYITPEMKEVETQVLNAEERILAVETRLFKELCVQLAASAEPLLACARALATLDVLAALAEVAALQGYVRPSVKDDGALGIIAGRHPVVERWLPAQERFVPNDTVFEEGECVRLITGPNMSGKSTYLRQVALIVLLAQMGSFVPAESASIGLVDRIFTRIGAQDELHAGHSTFMVEMTETASILNHATSRSLLILDEIGRGTSTYDGLSIAWAVIEHIHNQPRLKARTLFATHYHELTALANTLPGVRNYNVAVSEADGNVVFLHKIVPGGADRSYGIHVGQLAGLPRPVLARAQEILAELETNGQQPAAGVVAVREPQAPLFAFEHPLVEELKKLDLDGLSPIEALNKLAEWKKRL
ncbi:MAG: DNA mismatch repair protein MutS [Anaerolineales bacterium]|nr:DNA mismatch repair protein MutS [Anaerolineales bacterium]MBX3005855.1 DNA mismatch repair protein MutS [Anaerolineales bacterium]MCW5839443.1 DNA mismatch repair protein MutS [Anaerolineales bacterium]MCW5887078.1 DNA mismatch repair protein MutS [Anaerolineales bacterium]